MKLRKDAAAQPPSTLKLKELMAEIISWLLSPSSVHISQKPVCDQHLPNCHSHTPDHSSIFSQSVSSKQTLSCVVIYSNCVSRSKSVSQNAQKASTGPRFLNPKRQTTFSLYVLFIFSFTFNLIRQEVTTHRVQLLCIFMCYHFLSCLQVLSILA